MQSYLTNRINYVWYTGFSSFEYVTTYGVPQGSNLGPLMFILFLAYLLESLKCHVAAYNPLKALRRYKTILVFELLSEPRRSQVQVHATLPDYHMRGTRFGYLGLWFEPRLSFQKHITSASQIPGFVMRTAKLFRESTILPTLYYAGVHMRHLVCF